MAKMNKKLIKCFAKYHVCDALGINRMFTAENEKRIKTNCYEGCQMRERPLL